MKPTIPFSDFSRLDLRIGIIQEAKAMEGTDNLLLMKVEVGESEPRQLVAGLAKTHDPKRLVGEQIVVLVNLEEREIRGVTSYGMLLAADNNGRPILLIPEERVNSGVKVR